MKAIRVHSYGQPPGLDEVPEPRVTGPDDVIVRIGGAGLCRTDLHIIDGWLADYNATLPPLKEFVLPGGGTAASACHMARAICRRAERRCWALAHSESVGAASLQYLNRLSDLLFVLARVLARAHGGGEPLWQRKRDAPPGPDASGQKRP